MGIFSAMKKESVRNAVIIGSLCSISYLGVYFARNILGAVTPQIVNSGVYSESYIGANYCYCELFGGRYYFINDMSIDIGKKIVISCSVDVLYTYKGDIEGAWGCIIRAETIEGNNWGVGPIADEKLPINSRRNIETIKFGNSPFLGGNDEVLWEVYNGIPKIGDYFYWQKWKYEIDGSADSARADIVGESLPGPSDVQVHNGTLITIGNYRYKVRVGSEYTSLYLSPYN